VKDYRDAVIEAQADEAAELRDQNRQFVDLIADLAYENFTQRQAYLHVLTLVDKARKLEREGQHDDARA
jgi:hypothetical protein